MEGFQFFARPSPITSAPPKNRKHLSAPGYTYDITQLRAYQVLVPGIIQGVSTRRERTQGKVPVGQKGGEEGGQLRHGTHHAAVSGIIVHT